MQPSAMLDKLTIRMDKCLIVLCFVQSFRSICPICSTVCLIFLIIGPIWICNPLVLRKNLTIKKKAGCWNFLFSNQMCFVRTHRLPLVQFFCSPALYSSCKLWRNICFCLSQPNLSEFLCSYWNQGAPWSCICLSGNRPWFRYT